VREVHVDVVLGKLPPWTAGTGHRVLPRASSLLMTTAS
jgi:hypothetical protein